MLFAGLCVVYVVLCYSETSEGVCFSLLFQIRLYIIILYYTGRCRYPYLTIPNYSADVIIVFRRCRRRRRGGGGDESSKTVSTIAVAAYNARWRARSFAANAFWDALGGVWRSHLSTKSCVGVRSLLFRRGRAVNNYTSFAARVSAFERCAAVRCAHRLIAPPPLRILPECVYLHSAFIVYYSGMDI